MKTILYLQNAVGSDTIILDNGGIQQASIRNKEHAQAFKILDSTTNMMQIGNIKQQKLSDNFMFCRQENAIYIQSNYKNLDNSGRRLLFNFYIETFDIDTACNLLQTISKEKLNRECVEKEIEQLKEYKIPNKNSLFYFGGKLIDENGNKLEVEDPKGEIKQQSENQYFGNPTSNVVADYRQVIGNEWAFYTKSDINKQDCIKLIQNFGKYFSKNISQNDIYKFIK